MNDQIRTDGAGQEVFTRGQCGPGVVGLEQRVAGSFFEFSLSHPARSETDVVQQRERPRRSVTANQPLRVAVRAEVCEADAKRQRSSLDRVLGGAGHDGVVKLQGAVGVVRRPLSEILVTPTDLLLLRPGDPQQ